MPGGRSAQRLIWRGSLSFEGEDSWGHRVAISADPAEEGARPSDLLPLSLAACLSYDVVVVLRKKRQDLRAMEVVVHSEQEELAPWRFDNRADLRGCRRYRPGGGAASPRARPEELSRAGHHRPDGERRDIHRHHDRTLSARRTFVPGVRETFPLRLLRVHPAM